MCLRNLRKTQPGEGRKLRQKDARWGWKLLKKPGAIKSRHLDKKPEEQREEKKKKRAAEVRWKKVGGGRASEEKRGLK